MQGHYLFASVADVVSACPPMFNPSHSGCHFAPSTTEMMVATGLTALAVAVALVVLVGRKRDDRG